MEEKYAFSIKNNENKIKFFLIKTLNLIGWQTIDIYQNLNITFISDIKKNKLISKTI